MVTPHFIIMQPYLLNEFNLYYYPTHSRNSPFSCWLSMQGRLPFLATRIAVTAESSFNVMMHLHLLLSQILMQPSSLPLSKHDFPSQDIELNVVIHHFHLNIQRVHACSGPNTKLKTHLHQQLHDYCHF